MLKGRLVVAAEDQGAAAITWAPMTESRISA
jgi:hypothetical protein